MDRTPGSVLMLGMFFYILLYVLVVRLENIQRVYSVHCTFYSKLYIDVYSKYSTVVQK